MTSCYVTNYVPLQDDYNQAYKGHSANEIITQYGAPDRQTDDGAGGRILIYEESSSMTTKTTYLQFYVNKDNVCYGVKTNLEKMERHKDKKNTRLAWLVGGEILAIFGILGSAAIMGDL